MTLAALPLARLLAAAWPFLIAAAVILSGWLLLIALTVRLAKYEAKQQKDDP